MQSYRTGQILNTVSEDHVSPVNFKKISVLHSQPGKEIFPKDEKGNILAGKFTFLDAWVVGFSFFLKCLQTMYLIKYDFLLVFISCSHTVLSSFDLESSEETVNIMHPWIVTMCAVLKCGKWVWNKVCGLVSVLTKSLA